MTSLPTTFPVASYSSSQNVRDAIASYRRAQYFVAGSQVTAASDTETFSDDEEDDRHLGERDDEIELPNDGDAIPTSQDDFADQLNWEAEDDTSERPSTYLHPLRTNWGRDRQTPGIRRTEGRAQETTPLLRKAISFSAVPHPRRQSTSATTSGAAEVAFESAVHLAKRPTLPRRRSSASSSKSGQYNYGGKSTFGQTLFNSIAILLGIGMLSEPLAFAYSGWVTGTALIVCYGFVSCYTAKILAGVILSDPRLRSYADIGRKAFGQSSMLFISMMFCLELFAVSVILVTLLIPTIFLPLSLLSYTSILGIISSVLIIIVVIVDGFSKPDAPGSFWSPAETSIGPGNLNDLGLAFGLFMAGFSGHAVIPSLARDMADPSQFNRMINWAFAVATFLYALIGYAGYLMFGKYVSDEISIDLLRTSGYNPTLNRMALWMLVISPLSKFALTTQPLNATIEILLGIDVPLATPEDMASKSNGLTSVPRGSHVALKRVFAISQRVIVTVLSVLFSILVPEFSSVMAFLGSFSAFMLCVIGPVSAKIMLAGRCSLLDGIFLTLGVMMAIWGTVAAFLAV
ncbi:transmembrane amino acid transporter protein-domain-containing protein [Lyophyllum atratum]|nr:transmembrane amino acid transporter protein-domain-containing protein [Lyophyllum atratum]